MEEYICDKCNGDGYIQFYEPENGLSGTFHKSFCPKCFGDGKLNWIENLFGKSDDWTIQWNPPTG